VRNVANKRPLVTRWEYGWEKENGLEVVRDASGGSDASERR
jgi:hypothetical protein